MGVGVWLWLDALPPIRNNIVTPLHLCGHATLQLAVSVSMSVGQSVRPSVTFLNSEPVYALMLLPNRPRLDCRVSGLVFSNENRVCKSVRLEIIKDLRIC